MTTQQQIIMETIRDGMKIHTVTVDYDFANTGWIRRLDPLTLLATRSVHFDFQNGGATFTDGGSGVDGYIATHNYGKERRQGQIPAVKSTPKEMIDAVVNYLTETEEQ